jgi:hypothetical protein
LTACGQQPAPPVPAPTPPAVVVKPPAELPPLTDFDRKRVELLRKGIESKGVQYVAGTDLFRWSLTGVARPYLYDLMIRSINEQDEIRISSRREVHEEMQYQRERGSKKFTSTAHTVDLAEVREVLSADQILWAMAYDHFVDLAEIIKRLKHSAKPIPGGTLSSWRDNYPELSSLVNDYIREHQ